MSRIRIKTQNVEQRKIDINCREHGIGLDILFINEFFLENKLLYNFLFRLSPLSLTFRRRRRPPAPALAAPEIYFLLISINSLSLGAPLFSVVCVVFSSAILSSLMPSVFLGAFPSGMILSVFQGLFRGESAREKEREREGERERDRGERETGEKGFSTQPLLRRIRPFLIHPPISTTPRSFLYGI